MVVARRFGRRLVVHVSDVTTDRHTPTSPGFPFVRSTRVRKISLGHSLFCRFALSLLHHVHDQDVSAQLSQNEGGDVTHGCSSSLANTGSDRVRVRVGLTPADRVLTAVSTASVSRHFQYLHPSSVRISVDSRWSFSR